MKKISQYLFMLLVLSAAGTALSSFYTPDSKEFSFRFPFQKAGLNEKEAAAHLISRFSFGVNPGNVDEVSKMGVEKWFKEQLDGTFADNEIQDKLAGYASLNMDNQEIVKTYPKGGQILRMAVKDGEIERDSVNKGDKKDYRKELRRYMQENGLKPQAELLRELFGQKILRAAYSNNQLQEVMTDFWFNHFNVAISKGGVQQFVTSYERDVIRPNVLGKFETLLLATAKSPAMLAYLDNTKSSVNEENMMGGQQKLNKKMQERMESMDSTMQKNAKGKIKKPKMQGLNENYAREIMELHTLGVDGGYTQSDVTQAARVLTGWSLNPQIEYNVKARKLPNKSRIEKMGFVYDDNFLFAVNKHDKGEKKVLGQVFPEGGGYEEGEKLIHMLATHKATAKFISKKLAIRFV
ncbi:MAG: DUF1800 family protein, partial [Chitinophagaceae bacterium]